MTKREITTITLDSLHIDHEEDFDGTLDQLIQKLTDMRESVPAEYRDKIQVTSDYDSYDPGPGWVHIFYQRPETDEEMQKRLDKKEQYRRQREAEERSLLQDLKAKYE